ncbi:MAG: thermonuclease family protein [Deltaproteobacteria bacterium]|nr:thermonuclease family protein [Deltaproteobacteria bacterium]
MKKHIAFLVSALALVACPLALAAPALSWEAKVLSVHDGDTITVRREGRRVKIRLAYIDAPELDQPGGKAAARYLRESLRGQTVNAKPVDRDRYGRTVAAVFMRSGRDVNSGLVRAGMAWVFRRYCDDLVMIAAEAQARAAKRGLWGLPGKNIAPWKWRKGEK